MELELNVAKNRLREQSENPAMAAMREVGDLDRSAIQWETRDSYRDGWMQAAAIVDARMHTPVSAAYGPVEQYESLAAAYTRLLRRPITATQLAPAIPGGECK